MTPKGSGKALPRVHRRSAGRPLWCRSVSTRASAGRLVPTRSTGKRRADDLVDSPANSRNTSARLRPLRCSRAGARRRAQQRGTRLTSSRVSPLARRALSRTARAAAMPRSAPYRSCGRTLLLGRGSSPNPTCRDCRRKRRELAGQVRAPQSAQRRRCTSCSRPVRTAHDRCSVCRKPNAQRRGYDHHHQRARREALKAWRPGQPCAICGIDMPTTRGVYLARSADRTSVVGLAHAACTRHDVRRNQSESPTRAEPR